MAKRDDVECPQCGSTDVAFEEKVCSECESSNPFVISAECRKCGHWWEEEAPK